MADNKQRLVFSIIEFLNESIEDGTVKSDDKESLEVAVQCIGEAFGVDPSDPEQAAQLTSKPATLKNIFDVFTKTRDKAKLASGAGSTTDAAPNASSPSPASQLQAPSAEVKAEAEKLKAQGNSLMTSKKYDEAIQKYDEAIALDATNPVYFSNRAAAYASKGDHLSAIGDAEEAIAIDPKFVKAYSRLGHAQYSLGDFAASASAFERLENAKARLAVESPSPAPSNRAPAASTPPAGGAPAGLGGLADLFGSIGGGGGGMPDFASLMQNPEVMRMAGQLAANGGLANLMRDPNIANMASRFQSGDMPSADELRDVAGRLGKRRPRWPVIDLAAIPIQTR
ncbi:cytoplasmic protein [Ephemerocybe angulata]|uniref:Cytoplasmic protein n=1 Tax=Ephemerocybe angulata TaxID=980116 RepID=A0A8H6IKI4_9AGAR|nr:cytoplasmic protein [Tulosesus angulatus]